MHSGGSDPPIVARIIDKYVVLVTVKPSASTAVLSGTFIELTQLDFLAILKTDLIYQLQGLLFSSPIFRATLCCSIQNICSPKTLRSGCSLLFYFFLYSHDYNLL